MLEYVEGKTKNKNRNMRKTSPIFVLGIIAVLMFVGYGGFIFLNYQGALDTMKKNENTVKELQAQVLQFENERVLEAVAAKKTADQVQTDAIYWSEIIKKIRKTIPKDDGDIIADITSYAGNNSNGLSFSIKTIAGRDAPYFDVADLIEAFNESSDFDGSFVPGISSGLNERGEEILTFSMTTTYVEEDFAVEEEEDEALSGVLEEVLEGALSEESTEESAEEEPILR